jgi:glycogen(starch) synthase
MRRSLASQEMSDINSESQLRVLLLGPYPPPHGGVEISMASLRNFLLRDGICCEVVNLTRHRKTEGSGVYYPAKAIDVIRLLLQKKAEIIHLHIGGNVSWRLLGLGLLCSLLPGKKLILTLHSGGYPTSPAGKVARPLSLRGFLFRRFDGLIGVNRELVDMFVKFGVPRSKIRLILPFELPDQVPDVALPKTIRMFLETHSPVILTVSGVEPEYDLPAQIEVLGCVREMRRDAGLLIIGAGSRESEIRRQIRAKPYANHILLAGDVSHDVVLRVMSLSDVLLRTTLYDGDSIAVREALHLGLPVVATDNGMRPAGVTLIPISNREALVRAVGRVLDMPRARETSPGADRTNLQAVAKFYRELLSPA